MDKSRQVNRDLALRRHELREPSEPRAHTPTAGPTSPAAKLRDPAMVAMIDAAIQGKKGEGKAPAPVTPTPNPTPQGGGEQADMGFPISAPKPQEIEGYMVVDAAGEDELFDTFSKEPEKAARDFFDLDWTDVGQRELDTMNGRYHVRHVRLTILGPYAWPKE